MGEVADMIIDGTLCEDCGVVLDGEAPGFPRCCQQCEQERTISAIDFGARQLAAEMTHKTCRKCGKRVKWDGLSDHMRDKHGQS